MTIKKTIQKEFAKARERNWDKIYVFVDFHDTIMHSDYSSEWKEPIMYEHAVNLMEYLSRRKDTCLIAWTSTRGDNLQKYIEYLAKLGIIFTYVNENPDITTDMGYGDYDKKPYWNVVLDDKSGFDPETDILETFEAFTNEPFLTKPL